MVSQIANNGPPTLLHRVRRRDITRRVDIAAIASATRLTSKLDLATHGCQERRSPSIANHHICRAGERAGVCAHARAFEHVWCLLMARIPPARRFAPAPAGASLAHCCGAALATRVAPSTRCFAGASSPQAPPSPGPSLFSLSCVYFRVAARCVYVCASVPQRVLKREVRISTNEHTTEHTIDRARGAVRAATVPGPLNGSQLGCNVCALRLRRLQQLTVTGSVACSTRRLHHQNNARLRLVNKYLNDQGRAVLDYSSIFFATRAVKLNQTHRRARVGSDLRAVNPHRPCACPAPPSLRRVCQTPLGSVRWWWASATTALSAALGRRIRGAFVSRPERIRVPAFLCCCCTVNLVQIQRTCAIQETTFSVLTPRV